MESGRRLESTATLLALARGGDRAARDRRAARYLPILRRVAHGRLPSGARGMADTDDLVQVTLIRALNRVESFESRGEGAFLAYLRRILLNQIRDLTRRAATRPAQIALDADQASRDPSPLENAIGAERLDRYEEALEALSERDRQAVILRLEMGFTYAEIAEALGVASPNAVRMAVVRALARMSARIAGRGAADEI